jgi:hypothetical protein
MIANRIFDRLFVASLWLALIVVAGWICWPA